MKVKIVCVSDQEIVPIEDNFEEDSFIEGLISKFFKKKENTKEKSKTKVYSIVEGKLVDTIIQSTNEINYEPIALRFKRDGIFIFAKDDEDVFHFFILDYEHGFRSDGSLDDVYSKVTDSIHFPVDNYELKATFSKNRYLSELGISEKVSFEEKFESSLQEKLKENGCSGAGLYFSIPREDRSKKRDIFGECRIYNREDNIDESKCRKVANLCDCEVEEKTVTNLIIDDEVKLKFPSNSSKISFSRSEDGYVITIVGEKVQTKGMVTPFEFMDI